MINQIRILRIQDLALQLKMMGMTVVTLILLTLVSCVAKEEMEEPADVDFSRTALLGDLAEHIEQDFSSYLEALSTMQAEASAFDANPSISQLQALRDTWSTALLRWQHVAPYSFGLSAELALEAYSNIYPTSTERIEQNITSGDYMLGSANNLSAMGLQAIDYLIHAAGATDEEIVARYSSDDGAESPGNYLIALCEHLSLNTSQVANTWNSASAERASFIANDGNDQGSSLGLFLNAFNKSYEKSTRTEKLGIPSGALTFSMTPNPNTVEAYYEGNKSIVYLEESINAFEALYVGMESEDISLSDYLIALDARHGEKSLDEAIRNQIESVRSAIDLMDDPLSDFVVNEQETALAAFAEMQALVVLWKVDMMSALGILIIYQDNDGD